MSSIRTSPSTLALIGTVSLTIGGGLWYMSHKFRNDPHLVTNSQSDPHPYLRVRPDQNLKLFAVSQEARDLAEERPTITLADILDGKHDPPPDADRTAKSWFFW